MNAGSEVYFVCVVCFNKGRAMPAMVSLCERPSFEVHFRSLCLTLFALLHIENEN